ncbi:MAG: hypothetical protein LJE57_08105 [Gallionella sp.]|nr:hypothetical protein [Gallionella sp.]
MFIFKIDIMPNKTKRAHLWKEISLTLVQKILVLFVIWAAWFSAPEEARLDDQAVASKLFSQQIMMMHGSINFQTRTEGVIAERARRAAKFIGLVFILAFTLAGICVMNGIDGHHIFSMLSANSVTGIFDRIPGNTSYW